MDTIVLASNACKEIYGDNNKPNHFFTNLPQTMEFNGEYGVCLREIIYSSTIPTIVNETMTYVNEELNPAEQILQNVVLDFSSGGSLTDSGTFTYNSISGNYEFYYSLRRSYDMFQYYYVSVDNLPNGLKINKVLDLKSREIEKTGELMTPVLRKSLEFHVSFNKMKKFKLDSSRQCSLIVYGVNKFNIVAIPIKPGKYKDIEQLCDVLNSPLAQFNAKFEQIKGKFNYEPPQNSKLYLGKGLKYILGYTQTVLRDDYKMAEFYPDLTRGIFAMFVYVNIVKETMVGDKMVPLLRTVHIPSTKYGSTIHQIIENPIYVPLNRTSVNEIEVKVCDDMGDLIPFTAGKCLLMLDLKKL